MKPLLVTIQLDATPLLAGLLARLAEALARPPETPTRQAAPRPKHPRRPRPSSHTEALPSPPPAPAKLDPPPHEAPPAAVDQKWTPERERVLAQGYPAGRKRGEILADLLALPGPAPTPMQISAKAMHMGLRRPGSPPAEASDPQSELDRSPPAAEPESAPPAPVAEPPEPSPIPPAPDSPPRPPAPAGKVEIADYATILAWAGQRGLAPHRDGMDIPTVNRKRVQLGLLPFELTPRRAGNGALRDR